MQMDELACFTPGMLALGSSGYGPEESRKFLSLAEEVLTPESKETSFFFVNLGLKGLRFERSLV